ncbi:MAG: glycosyltransferase family 4 protein [Algoriphagus sp.]|uniref:glycosyltransferase family 4 protein n=1 Tax=Algoriphagus sp. TaxID=1872435 RepID=UPI0017E08222|nr:glycosyltransferase family 4 protein [Algoriphagus sp.]NVJ85992.1 glycosyltransferase family 4 protein [Algoriphagus sp.]
MRIAVSHPGKQYVHLLLQGLYQKGYLDHFYTLFAANAIQPYLQFFPKRIKKDLKKRLFLEIPSALISQRWDLFLMEKLGKIQSEADLIQKIYDPFDQWVANKIEIYPPELCIGYENANLHTFRKAKGLGITTVLDLAQIHHHAILDIHSKHGFLNSSYSEDTLAFINSRKEEALAYTDYILTLSSFARESLLENGISAKKVFIVNLGVNHQIFYPKKDYDKKKRFRFLFVGTITRRKGLDVLFQAFKELNLPAVELVLVGPMADGQAFFKQYEGLFTHVPFLHHEELSEQYRQADVFVFPSYLDSWAQTVVEAMACGTPAIVSENTGAKDAVIQGGGFVVPTGDVEALKEKMTFCFENRDEVEKLGKKAAEIAQNYTLENYHNQVIHALNQIAREKNQS